MTITGTSDPIGGTKPKKIQSDAKVTRNVNSMLVDSDGQIAGGDKTSTGDVEAPGCPEVPPGSICGQKFDDLNHNGVKDAGEPGMLGWTIQLAGLGAPVTTVTDEQGNFCFTGLPSGSYTISEMGVSPSVQTALWNAGLFHSVVKLCSPTHLPCSEPAVASVKLR